MQGAQVDELHACGRFRIQRELGDEAWLIVECSEKVMRGISGDQWVQSGEKGKYVGVGGCVVERVKISYQEPVGVPACQLLVPARNHEASE
jgi:hypothetical protein